MGEDGTGAGQVPGEPHLCSGRVPSFTSAPALGESQTAPECHGEGGAGMLLLERALRDPLNWGPLPAQPSEGRSLPRVLASGPVQCVCPQRPHYTWRPPGATSSLSAHHPNCRPRGCQRVPRQACTRGATGGGFTPNPRTAHALTRPHGAPSRGTGRGTRREEPGVARGLGRCPAPPRGCPRAATPSSAGERAPRPRRLQLPARGGGRRPVTWDHCGGSISSCARRAPPAPRALRPAGALQGPAGSGPPIPAGRCRARGPAPAAAARRERSGAALARRPPAAVPALRLGCKPHWLAGWSQRARPEHQSEPTPFTRSRWLV